MNQKLTSIHQEVKANLESIHGALLRLNRNIQAEGTSGILKWDKSYKRSFRRGKKNIILELTLISCGFNLYKYHIKKQRISRTDICQDWRFFIRDLFYSPFSVLIFFFQSSDNHSTIVEFPLPIQVINQIAWSSHNTPSPRRMVEKIQHT